jgi:hypothetical protein
MELGYPASLPTPPPSGSLVVPERDPWLIARNRFLQDSTPEEKLLFNSATVETLYYDTSNTEREDRKSSKMRNVARKLQPLIDVIREFGAAMDVYSNAYPLVLAPLWGSIRVLLVLGQSYKGFFDVIVRALEEIGEALPRYSVSELRSWHCLCAGPMFFVLTCRTLAIRITKKYFLLLSTTAWERHSRSHILI